MKTLRQHRTAAEREANFQKICADIQAMNYAVMHSYFRGLAVEARERLSSGVRPEPRDIVIMIGLLLCENNIAAARARLCYDITKYRGKDSDWVNLVQGIILNDFVDCVASTDYRITRSKEYEDIIDWCAIYFLSPRAE